MARLCCPGREGGRQVAVLLKATRTAFERGTHRCCEVLAKHTHLPRQDRDGTVSRCLSLVKGPRPRHLAASAGCWMLSAKACRAVPVLTWSLQHARGLCAGHRGVVDAHEAAQEVQQRVMVLFQLLEDVLVTLRDSHSSADLSGVP